MSEDSAANLKRRVRRLESLLLNAFHDIGRPLAVANNSTHFLTVRHKKAVPRDAKDEKHLKIVREEILKVAEVLSQLLAALRGDDDPPTEESGTPVRPKIGPPNLSDASRRKLRPESL